jgi:hypothetical protein
VKCVRLSTLEAGAKLSYYAVKLISKLAEL